MLFVVEAVGAIKMAGFSFEDIEIRTEKSPAVIKGRWDREGNDFGNLLEG